MFFSVVIPLFNKEPHVARCISSVLAQTHQSFEVIIVNDASTDNSIKEVNKFIDPRIRLVHRESPGPGGYAARNLGIKLAQSEYIAFLDADDEWYSCHLEKMKQVVEKFPDAAIYGCGWETVENGSQYVNAFYKKNSTSEYLQLTLKGYLENMISGLSPFWSSTVVVKDGVFDSFKGFPEGETNRGGDLSTWLTIMAISKRGAWSAHVGAIYYKNSVNMVTSAILNKPNFWPLKIKELESKFTKNELKLVKEYSNKIIINEWKWPIVKYEEKPFCLFSNLFCSVDPFRCYFFSFLSLFPAKILFALSKIKKHFRHLS